MDLSSLIALSARYRSETSEKSAPLPQLSVYAREATSDIEASIYEPVMCLILQGAKTASLGAQTVELTPGDALLVSHDLPVVSRITRASRDAPYLAVILSIDLDIVRGLHEEVADAPLTDAETRSLSAGPADTAWLAPLTRYFELMDSPRDARVLGPGVLREIHYRLLISPIGAMLRKLVAADSQASRITKVIQRLREEFRGPISVPDLARTAGMSASSFHAHFKTVTGTTPLQYQKDLRLIEARALLTDRRRSVAEAAFSVGYESPTHFSRDYSRKFGRPPSRESAAEATRNAARLGA